jgi:hypothetical protein
MAATLSYTEVKQTFEHVLDEVVSTAAPVRFEFKGRVLTICVVEATDKLARLEPHPECLAGDPEDIVHLDWSGTGL